MEERKIGQTVWFRTNSYPHYRHREVRGRVPDFGSAPRRRVARNHAHQGEDCANGSKFNSDGGAAPVHRDPPQPVYRLRKIQCISQKTWNHLRRWLRGAPGPLAAQGGEGGQGAGGRKKSKNKVMDSGVSHQVKLGSEKQHPCSAVHLSTLLHHDLLQRS